MRPQDLKARTYAFSVAVVKFCMTLPDTIEGRRIRGQLHDAATSVGANYRAACRARSRAEFIAKLGIAGEEADESDYWLNVLTDSGLSPKSTVAPLIDEAIQLSKILSQSQITAKANDAKARTIRNRPSAIEPQK